VVKCGVEGKMMSESVSRTKEDGCGVEVEMISESVSKTREDGCEQEGG
jgi:hypothetical protein